MFQIEYKKNNCPWICIAFMLFSSLIFQNNLWAQQNNTKSYTMGITRNLFEDINMKDVKVSLQLWVNLLARRFEALDTLDVRIFQNSEELLAATKNNELDVLYISALQYILEKDLINMTPVIKSNVSKKDYYDIVICSYTGNKIKDFSSLRNKKILVQGGKYKQINELWLDLLCLQVGVKDKNKFFSKIEVVEKPMQAVLPVFFKKSDYCLVNSGSLELLAEMNPQISKSIEILFKRENLINDIICIKKSLPESIKELINIASLDYKSLPKNEQINKIFKTSGASKIKESDFNGIISLINDYKKYETKTK